MNTSNTAVSQNTRRVDPIAELAARIERADRFGGYALWNGISSDRQWEGFRLPSKMLYSFVQKCPKFSEPSDVQGDMLTSYRDHVLNGLTVENLTERERRFMTYVQAASFASFAEYLKAKQYVLVAYREVVRPIPLDLKERFAKCERFHRKEGAFTKAAFLAAGYKATGDGRVWVFLHPQSRDSVTMLAPAEVISVADKMQMRSHAEAAKQARRDARVGPQRGTGAKSAEGGGTSKKSVAKDKKRGKK